MAKWESPVERQIREAMEAGAFDNLPGKGKPLDLGNNPFEHPMMPTLRRVLRDNGVTHPLLDARKAFEAEIEERRATLRRAWKAHTQRGGSPKAWDQAVDEFRTAIQSLNREIKLNNLKAPLPNFIVRTVDAEAEIQAICGGATGDHRQ